METIVNVVIDIKTYKTAKDAGEEFRHMEPMLVILAKIAQAHYMIE